MLSSTTAMGLTIRPTAAERAAGRLMRAPDHSAGDGGDAGQSGAGAGAAAQGAGDAGQAGDAAAASGDGSDGGAGDGGDAGDGDGGAGDASLIGSAGADGKGDDAGDGKDGDDAPAVPEKYELKPIKVGEGDDAAEVEIDAALLETATPVLKEAGVTQEQAEKLAPLALEIEKRVMARNEEAFAGVKADWAKATKDDPEIGGKNLPATMANVARALDHFGEPSVKDKDGNETNEFRRMLNETGIGNHPALVRMFAKIGAAAGEDGALARGDKGAAVKKSPEEVLYPNDVPKEK